MLFVLSSPLNTILKRIKLHPKKKEEKPKKKRTHNGITVLLAPDSDKFGCAMTRVGQGVYIMWGRHFVILVA